MRGQEYLTSGKEYVEPRKTQYDEGTRGKSRSVSRTRLYWGRGPILTWGQLSESEEKHLRLRGKQLISGSLNGMRAIRTPGLLGGMVAGSWSLGMWNNPRVKVVADCRDRSRGCGGGGCGGKCLWRKARQPQKLGDTAESHIAGGASTIASLSPDTSIGS